MEIRENIPLAPLTTFQIGGPARYYAEARGADDIRAALREARSLGVPLHIIAGGSNLLVPDEGLDALVVRVASDNYDISDGVVTADAGANLLSLITATGKAGYAGWEKMAGIPGTLGGAVRGNAGAFGTEIKDVFVDAEAIDLETGDIRTLSNEEADFGYRSSFFKRNPAWVILSTRLNLVEGDAYESEHLIWQTIADRERRHLQNVRAAGSFFMNPIAPWEVVREFEEDKQTKSREGRVPAGWLIEKSGMKGARVGGAIASHQHPNYLVNESGASYDDVRRLAGLIREKVFARYGVTLTEEVSIL